MAGGVEIKLDERDFAKLQAKLPGKPRIVTKGLRKIMRGLASQARTAYRKHVPRGKKAGKRQYRPGNLSRSARVQSRPFSAAVLFNPVARDGKFRYGYALNASPKFHHKGWLDRAKDDLAAGPVPNAVGELKREIESLFNS